MGSKYEGSKEIKRALDTYIKLLRCTNTLLDRIHKRAPLPGRITPTQFGVLEALWHCGSLSQKEISKKILRSSGNITLVVDNLERNELIERHRNTGDRRISVVALTEKGKALITSYFPFHAEAIFQEMSILSKSEQETLGRLCKKLGLRQIETAETRGDMI